MGLPDHVIAECVDCGEWVALPITTPDGNAANNVLSVTVEFGPLYEHRERVHSESRHDQP